MKKGLPPTLILQGTAERWIPVASVERFVAQCHSLGSECELALFSGRNHHFYNHKHYFELRPHLEGPYSSADFGFISYLLEHFLRNHEFLEKTPVVSAS